MRKNALRPIYIGWDITHACNLRCKHCNRSAGSIPPDELSDKETIDVTNQIVSEFSDVDHVALGGGEPLLRPNLEEIVKVFYNNDIRWRINTNGTIMSEKILSLLEKVYLIRQ